MLTKEQTEAVERLWLKLSSSYLDSMNPLGLKNDIQIVIIALRDLEKENERLVEENKSLKQRNEMMRDPNYTKTVRIG